MAFEPGYKLGPYEILGAIGSGGMGSVYKARDSRLGRTVAIKVVSDTRDGQEFQERLRREAKAASALTHQNIIAIYDVLGLEEGEAIVMEYVDGQSLREALQKKSVSTDQAIEVVAQVATALAAAHKSGIVHRDIKPENIILTATHQAKVLDFGIAKVLHGQQRASEEAATQTVEHQTRKESYSVLLSTCRRSKRRRGFGRLANGHFCPGVVLYESIADKRPFSGNNTIEVIHALI